MESEEHLCILNKKKMSITTWALDPTHSELLFRVKHLMIANVKGEFRKFNVQVSLEGDDFTSAQVAAQVDVNSVDTNNADRDGHLKSPDFFDTASHPEMKFQSTSITKKGDALFAMQGDLTIKGHTQSVTLDVEFGGLNKDPWGNEKAGYSFTTTINRKDFGLNWNAALETGGVLVSEEVKISGELQFAKQAS
jgi:polyisoprenoid-binding protein YceI